MVYNRLPLKIYVTNATLRLELDLELDLEVDLGKNLVGGSTIIQITR
jgi:hypothetical protein